MRQVRIIQPTLAVKNLFQIRKLYARLDEYKVGDAVKISVMRDGKSLDLDVTLQAGN